MKILVTGAGGFIGSNLALELEKKFPQAEIVALDDFSTGKKENLSDFSGRIASGSITNENFLAGLGKFNLIFHQAAITDTTVSDREKMFEVNFEGFKNTITCLEEGGTFVYASSAGVYGNGPSPMKEDQILSPQNVYAESKVAMDKWAKQIQDKIKIVGLRYFNVYGPREKHKKKAASMIYQLAKQMKEGKRPRIFKWGEQRRDFVYVKDVVEANILASRAQKSGIYNVGTGRAASFNEIIKILNKVLRTNYEPDYFDNPWGFYQNLTQASCELAQKELQFRAKWNLEEGIADYLKSISF